ncbi:hypothetical protein [Haladaptatus sp. ZSTT2]|uniref:hypothetical protein n=1 Tax=Haladaptatus sp. ZSTT2 TaxID=3120515 RepID=UPI00300EF49B
MRQWVFLYGNRRWIALFLSALIFCFLLGVGAIWEFEMERLVVETRAVQTLFNTLLGGVILFLETLARIDRLYAQRRGTSTPPITMLDG